MCYLSELLITIWEQYDQLYIVLLIQFLHHYTFFSKDDRRLTKAEILHNKLSISMPGPFEKNN